MINITVNARATVRELRADERQVPFALANAVNDTVKSVQEAERRQLRKAFTLRRPEWADRSVKITQFAKKGRPISIIGIHPPGGDERADVLGKFETDREKLPKSGTIAIPVSRVGLARGSTGVLRNRNRPRDLVASGKAFIVRKKMGKVGEGLILQRLKLGRGRTSIVALFYLARRARIEPDLHFTRTAIDTVNATFEDHMTRRLDEAMRTAR